MFRKLKEKFLKIKFSKKTDKEKYIELRERFQNKLDKVEKNGDSAAQKEIIILKKFIKKIEKKI